ncbi:ribosome biogenesis GTPase Der [Athalassotoga saccharophila]|uniref:ribosome biogenesis GTPase Der n=1 Tax=Athalassotoga saccharophila TaxID=1441386 RepID=UPI001379E8F2|nr:ribosome biogenesis GTPase Der [Athalassotoga saccharophila]BBJ28456.1 GTP-binding protein EngA [Athalassotoga saccharophila]
MKSDFDLPAIVIAGRKNAGKSSIFNRLVGFRRSLVADYEGLTRDPVIFDMNIEGKAFRLVDLPGYFLDPSDEIEIEMNLSFKKWISQATLVIFVIDGRSNLTQEDIEIAEIIRKSGKKYIFVVNKCESDAYKKNLGEIYSISMGEPIFISAEHNIGFDLLEEEILKSIPESKIEIKNSGPKVSIIGKPNVGKSSLFNSIINQPISIVTSIPGTTRDTIDASLNYKDRQITFIDTAGLRKRSHVQKGSVESFSGARTIRAIMNSDISLIVVDASEGITEQDKKVASMVVKYSKASIIVGNKWDLAIKNFIEEVERELFFVSYSPFVPVSALNRWNITDLMDQIIKVYDQYTSTLPTSKIAGLSFKFSSEHSIPSKLKIFYATQVDTSPPTISVFVNSPELFTESVRRSYENFLRRNVSEFENVPLKIIVKARRENDK